MAAKTENLGVTFRHVPGIVDFVISTSCRPWPYTAPDHTQPFGQEKIISITEKRRHRAKLPSPQPLFQA